MFTHIVMWREFLITKEKMLEYSNGKVDGEKMSINDDIESLIEDIQLAKNPESFVHTYFLPQLTEEELALVERKDDKFMDTLFGRSKVRRPFGTHSWGDYVHSFEYKDVDKAEMKASESDSKYLKASCVRTTETLFKDLIERQQEEIRRQKEIKIRKKQQKYRYLRSLKRRITFCCSDKHNIDF